MLLGAFIITLIAIIVLNVFGDFSTDWRHATKLQLVLIQHMLFFIAFAVFLIAWKLGVR